MAGVGTYYQKASLDWMLVNGATPTRPSAFALGLANGAPTSVSASEVATGSGLTRQTLIMAPATAVAGGSATASNASTMAFGTANTAAAITGIQMWDQVASGGSMLLFGNLSAARTLSSGDSLTFAIASIIVTLA